MGKLRKGVDRKAASAVGVPVSASSPEALEPVSLGGPTIPGIMAGVSVTCSLWHANELGRHWPFTWDFAQIDSADAEVRANCASSIASLLSQDSPDTASNVDRLVRAGVVRRLVARALDPEPSVVIQAIGALRLGFVVLRSCAVRAQ
jgi:hypothetical protein